MIHLLANTWMVQPVRDSKLKDQIHKSREILGSLLLTGLNLAITHTVTALLIDDTVPIRQDNLNQEVGLSLPLTGKRNIFLLLQVLPAALSYLVGCGLLLLFYKTVHSWRHLGKQRERHCFGKLGGTKRGLVVETSFWTQVMYSMLGIMKCSNVQ